MPYSKQKFCDASCVEECRYGIIQYPDTMPVETIEQICVENVRLKEEIEYWKAKAQANWDILETVATGEKLRCERCQKYHPCRCDDGQ